MAADTVSYLIGGFFGAVALIGLVMNSTVLMAMYKGKMVRSSTVYILSSQTMAIDTVLIIVHLVYHAPCVAFQTYLYPPFIDALCDILLMYCWYHNSLSHILIALNRFVVIVLKRADLFTKQRTVALACMHHLLAAVLAALTQILLPCCRLRFSWAVFSFAFEMMPGITTNFSDHVILVPVNIAASVVSIVSYSAIFFAMRNSRRGTNMQLDHDKRRRHQEYLYAIQFAAMAVIYSLAWILFHEFPNLIGTASNIHIYLIVTLLVQINSLANATVYLINNKEIKSSIRRMLGNSSTVVIDTTHSMPGRDSTR